MKAVTRCFGIAGVAVCGMLVTGAASAAAMSDYALTETFSLPGSAPFDVLGDGRLVTVDSSANVYVETAVGARTFNALGTLPNADFNNGAYGGAAFVRVSPDGSKIAVGNNGGAIWSNYEVGVFNTSDLSGTWFAADHYDAEWIDGTNLALTAGALAASRITVLDTTSTSPTTPTNPVVVTNINGSSAGIAFDSAGNLYTGNAYSYGGPSDTGWIKAIQALDWQAALTGGAAVDFENGGTLVADLLSAATLGFDADGNLHVGGGDLYTGSDYNYAALVSASAVADALDGNGPADPLNPADVRKFDPSASAASSYDVNFNIATGELLLSEGSTVYAYVVPEPATLATLLLAAALTLRRRAC